MSPRSYYCREKKREREREELWKKLHELESSRIATGTTTNNGTSPASSKGPSKLYSNVDNLNSESAMNNNNLLANQISGTTTSSSLGGGALGNSISGAIISNSGSSGGGTGLNSTGTMAAAASK